MLGIRLGWLGLRVFSNDINDEAYSCWPEMEALTGLGLGLGFAANSFGFGIRTLYRVSVTRDSLPLDQLDRSVLA